MIALAQECGIGKVDRASIVSAVDLLPAFCEIAGVHFQHRISLMESARWRLSKARAQHGEKNRFSGRRWPHGRPGNPSPQGRCFQIYGTQRRQDEGALSGVSQIGIKKTQKNDSLSLLTWADRGNLFQRSSKGHHSC